MQASVGQWINAVITYLPSFFFLKCNTILSCKICLRFSQVPPFPGDRRHIYYLTDSLEQWFTNFFLCVSSGTLT